MILNLSQLMGPDIEKEACTTLSMKNPLVYEIGKCMHTFIREVNAHPGCKCLSPRCATGSKPDKSLIIDMQDHGRDGAGVKIHASRRSRASFISKKYQNTQVSISLLEQRSEEKAW